MKKIGTKKIVHEKRRRILPLDVKKALGKGQINFKQVKEEAEKRKAWLRRATAELTYLRSMGASEEKIRDIIKGKKLKHLPAEELIKIDNALSRYSASLERSERDFK